MNTSIGTARLSAPAIIQITIRSLISASQTIRLTITNALIGNACHTGKTGAFWIRTLPCPVPAWELDSIASMLVLILITVVTTIVHTVADIRAKHALVIVALEVISGTVHGATSVGFVTGIITVRSTITIPTLKTKEL